VISFGLDFLTIFERIGQCSLIAGLAKTAKKPEDIIPFLLVYLAMCGMSSTPVKRRLFQLVTIMFDAFRLGNQGDWLYGRKTTFIPAEQPTATTTNPSSYKLLYERVLGYKLEPPPKF